jgi:hypothetical protein
MRDLKDYAVYNKSVVTMQDEGGVDYYDVPHDLDLSQYKMHQYKLLVGFIR